MYSISGKFTTPPDKKGAEFSKTNWGNYELYMLHGSKVFVKCATTFLKKINSLKDEQWDDIFKAALSFQATGKQPKTVKEDEGQLSETDTNEEDELMDPQYNEVSNAADLE